MPTHQSIGFLKGMGIVFLIAGVLSCVAYGVQAFQDAAAPYGSIEHGLATIFAIVAASGLLVGGFVWSVCFVLAIIAEGILDNGDRLDEVNRNLYRIRRATRNSTRSASSIRASEASRVQRISR
jgi:hypothetical protein